ncbi:uncharacterized protein LOC119164172 isoform X3 [Rhipicephalus microplus]|uniref:uncharacterized protein LOC119164172 isoform X3 n=1 Tax=Rhipicephalus microplus TaxID=6941 RepID=UPI003F6D2EF3
MDSSLMYRGLPGGPTKIKFAEELPRHCLCGHCGMITLSMYQDPDNHMFCDDCLLEQSTKHGVYHIFCSYESRNIAIHEEHYVSCKKLVECPSCGESIETEKWNGHRCPLENEQAVSKAKEKNGASMKLVQDPESKGNQKRLVLHPPQTHFETRAYRRHCDRQALNIYTSPSETLGQAEPAVPRREWQVTCDTRGTAPSVQNSNGENHGPEATSLCQYCQRKVKEINMQRHLNNCTKAPKPCVYCDKMILPETMQMHFHECDRNPDNIPQCISSELEAGDVSNPPQSNDLDETAVATNRSLSIGDGAIWLCHLASGDWLGAFVAMEESFKATKFDQHVRYAYLSQAFVGLKEYACVADFLEKPHSVQPFDCLLAALFVRKYLPRDVWSKRQKVTWTNALQYMPHFLASRLSDEAVDYLSSFPIFVDGIGHREAGENSLCGEEYKSYPLPELHSIPEEPQRSRSEAHGGKKSTKKETSKPDSEDEAPSPAESGKQHSSSFESQSSSLSFSLLSDLLDYRNNPAPIGTLFQEDNDKAGAKLGADERARNENADRTVYLNTSPEPSVRRALRTGSSSNSIANACTTSDRDVLFSVIAGASRRPRIRLPIASQSIHLVNMNRAPVYNSTMDNYEQGQESDGTLITGSIAPPSAGLATSDTSRNISAPEDAIRENFIGRTQEGPMTCREFIESYVINAERRTTSYPEIEHYERRSWLPKQAPSKPVSAVTLLKQCLASGATHTNSAMVSKHNPSKPRAASFTANSSLTSECASPLPPARGIGRGSPMLKCRVPKYPGTLLGYSPDAISPHPTIEANFEDAEPSSHNLRTLEQTCSFPHKSTPAGVSVNDV